MKIIVCGDSFMTKDVGCPGGHFSEQLSPHEVINLARGGISNVGICFQLEQALNLNPDVVIVGVTDSGRMEVPTGQSNFNPMAGLRNIAYTHKASASCSSKYVGNRHAAIASDTIPTLIGEECGLGELYDIPNAVRHAVKEYLTYIHVPELKQLTDSWMISHWVMTLEQRNIQVIHAKDIMQEAYKYSGDNTGSKSSPWVFHTDLDTQITVRNVIKEKFNI